MAYCIVHEVCHQALDQSGVAKCWGRDDAGVDVDTSAFRLLPTPEEHGFGDLAEVERLPPLNAPLARRQSEEGIDEPFLLLAELERLLARCAQVFGSGVGVRKGDLKERPLACQGGP